MDWTQTVKRCFASDSVLYTSHARREMKQEPFGTISEEEVFEAMSASEVLEEYLDDEPYPSVLLFGLTQVTRPIHVVCAYDAHLTVRSSLLSIIPTASDGVITRGERNEVRCLPW